MQELKDLTRLFEKLGAREPELWAESQVEEGINQLSRFVFLREAWKRVINENDTSWIEIEIQNAKSEPTEPGAGLGLALENLLSTGASEKDITQIARHAQWKLLFDLCYLLEGPEDLEEEIENLSWRLVEVNEDGEVIATIDSLHESVLETDPTGREMRPLNA